MALDSTPASSQSDGRWKICYLATGAPLSVAILNGAGGKNLTYGFTADGFNYSIAQDTVEDKRLTLVQNLARPGKKTETLEVKYVDTADAAAPATLLVEGAVGTFTLRRGVDNTTTWTVGQIVDVITFVAGAQRPDAPTENGLDTISQTLFITAVTQRKAVLVA